MFVVSSVIRPAILILFNTLNSYVAITYWDQHFRLAYTASFENNSKPAKKILEVRHKCRIFFQKLGLP